VATKTKRRRASKRGRKRSGKRRSPANLGDKLLAVPGRAARAARGAIDDQMRDIYGVGLLLLAVIAALGTYIGRAGAVGATLAAVSRGLFGYAGYAVPVLIAYVGILLVGDRPVEERGRRGIGVVLLVAATVGGLHLAGGSPHPAEGIRGMWEAGGLAGWTIARPLELALGVWGAVAVLTAVLGLGLLIFTKTPLSAVGRGLARSLRFLTAAVRGLRLPRRRAADDRAHPDERSDRDRVPTAPVDPPPAPREETAEVRPDPVERAVLRLEEELQEAGRAPRVPTAAGLRKAAKVLPPDGWERYELPPMELLGSGQQVAGANAQKQIRAQSRALQATFEQFGVDATVARTSRGPTVTRFEVELGPGVQVKKVVNLGDDISYALAAPDVRIVAPIPGKSAIGVEVPNRERDLITLRDVLESEEAVTDRHPLRVGVGVDIAGMPALINLTSMPHLLISGATGSGKSVTLNAMIASVLLRARPDECRMILVDPKRVELNHYEGAPHLLSPVITEPKRAAAALEWVVREMEQRYETLAILGFRNIDAYNDAVAERTIPTNAASLITEEGASAAVAEAVGDDEAPYPFHHLPYILVVIDELADLMLVAPRDVEDAICRIAQMARAVGIHLVIATQRPSVDVITGLIKANIPSRLALATASQTDSRTILDQVGAEKLIGDGDMLFLPSSQGKPSRLQGCYVSEKEIGAVVDYCKRQRDPDYVDGVARTGVDPDDVDLAEVSADDDDELLLLKAMDLVVRSGLGSTSMLQRKLRIGFARAGRLMDELEERGVVGPSEGSKARDVLMTVEELEEQQREGLAATSN
jgi:DNA segregation ATPase FtsK/SpoIIIE, S-DNA-T family